MSAGNGPSVWDQIFAVEDVREILTAALDWLQTTLLTLDTGLQVGLIAVALIPALFFGPRLGRVINQHLVARAPEGPLRRLARAAGVLAVPVALYLSLLLFQVILGAFEQPTAAVGASISLLTAWIVTRVVTLVIRSPFWSSVAFYVAWPIAALSAFGLLDEVAAQLQALSIPVGEGTDGAARVISLFDVVRTLIYFAILFWGAAMLGRLVESRLNAVDEVTPTLKALIVKVVKVALPVVAFVIALQIAGFNLATLAVFSGALGLGIGLGLQKMVSNFLAGFTLIADRSIKPGDVIQIDNTFGWVTGMAARYVAIRTRDGTEHLIPNDRFMTEGVVNWSRSDKVIRLHAPFAVAYDTEDLKQVQALAREAAQSTDRVVDHPTPVCNLMAFADSRIEFDLRFWIQDPSNGLANVRSDVYLAIWERLQANKIRIPYPQHDLHIKTLTRGDRPAPPAPSQDPNPASPSNPKPSTPEQKAADAG